MTLNTSTGKLIVTKTERGYLDKAKGVLVQLGRLGEGDLASAADDALEAIHRTQASLNGTPVVEAEMPY